MTRPQPAKPTTHLLYLHGFRSSPGSFKARCMAAWMRSNRPDVHWWCPSLPPSPAAAWRLITDGIQHWPHDTLAVIGSSLGGFYATAVAESTGCRAMLLNPAINPARDLTKYIGEQTQFHAPDERFFFRPEFIDELKSLHQPVITQAGRYGAVIARGDEVLDWREMLGRYPGATVHLLEGGDHAISDFEQHLPFVLNFLNLCD